MTIPQEIEEIVAGFEGEISVAAKDLGTGATFNLHPDRKCAAASVIKLPILIHAMLLAEEGRLALDDRLTLRDADKVPGSGILTQLSAGLTLSVLDACVMMTVLSDNTATNLILNRVGIEPVNCRMRDIGISVTTLFRKVFSDQPPSCEDNRRFGLAVTTPREMKRILCSIQDGTICSAETCGHMRKILAKQQYRDSIPRILPAGSKFEGKSGALDNVRNDVGIVTLPDGGEIAMAIFCQNMPRPLWTADNPGHLAIAKIARAIVTHFQTGIAQR